MSENCDRCGKPKCILWCYEEDRGKYCHGGPACSTPPCAEPLQPQPAEANDGKPTGEAAGLVRYYANLSAYAPPLSSPQVYLADEADALLAAERAAHTDLRRALDDAKQIIAEKDAELAALRPLADIGKLAVAWDAVCCYDEFKALKTAIDTYRAANPASATEE